MTIRKGIRPELCEHLRDAIARLERGEQLSIVFGFIRPATEEDVARHKREGEPGEPAAEVGGKVVVGGINGTIQSALAIVDSLSIPIRAKMLEKAVNAMDSLVDEGCGDPNCPVCGEGQPGRGVPH